MLDCNCVVLYVNDPNKSARFYGELFNQEVTISSENFATIALPSGLQVGLYRRTMVTPAVSGKESLSELCVMVESDESVDKTYQGWQASGINIMLAPKHEYFAYTFIATDPDGHRIRVSHPKK